MNIIEEFEKAIKEANSILVTGHTFPDADAVCSAQVMKMLLKKQFGKDCDVCFSGKIGRLLKPFCKDIIVESEILERYDLVIGVDCSESKRFGDLENQFKLAKRTINIDHHDTNTNYADINIINSDASSTCEIIYSLCLERFKEAITPQLAKYAYAGIITDTNGLMSDNINASTYTVISDILSKGTNVDIIKNYFFKSFSKAKLQLLGKALNSMQFYDNSKIAVVTIEQKDFEKCNASFDDTLGIVDYALNCYLIDIAIAVIEQSANNYYVSLRSKKTNVADIAMQFGGGGHTNISAFQYEGNKADFFNELMDYCTKNSAVTKTQEVQKQKT